MSFEDPLLRHGAISIAQGGGEMRRKFKSKWKLGLCQQRGCKAQVTGRSPLCSKHLQARLTVPAQIIVPSNSCS